MGGCRVAITVAPIMVLAVMMGSLQSLEATTYTVGDSSGWIEPTTDSSFYSTWAAKYTFHVDDILVFRFGSSHTLAQVSAEAYTNCDTNTSNSIAFYETGPVSVTLKSTGSVYFICTISDHCTNNQKLAINVAVSSGTPSPPPPSNSASSLAAAAATSVISMFVYVFGVLNY